MKAIIWDLSEVFVTGLFGTERLLSEELGHKVTNKMLLTPALRKFFLGEITENQLADTYVWQFGWDITPKRVIELIRANFTQVDGTRSVLEDLQTTRDYKHAVLSVNGREWVDALERMYQFNHLFDEHCYSYDTKRLKPHLRAFLHAADCLRCWPQECIVIDDLISNVQSARKAGFRAIQFTSAAQLRADLVCEGVLLHSVA